MDAQTFFGVWSPLDYGRLPVENTKDIDFGAWYITETGTIGEDPVAYKEGNWLIYICEARGTLAERKFWKTTNGIALFNRDPSFNTPEAGHYTKVLMDNKGNIVAGENIEYEDLPQEALKKFEDFTGEHLKSQVINIVKDIFSSAVDDTVVFEFDPKLGTIRANAKIDEDTIYVDDDGYLAADVSSSGEGGGGSKPQPSEEYAPKHHKHPVEDITGIDEHFGHYLASQDFIALLQNNLLDIIDGTTLIVNEEGYLAVSPDVIGGEGGGGGNDCANHTHTIDQITGLTDYIQDYINNIKIETELSTKLAEYVDGVTISINEDGKLSAIAMEVGPHHHKMSDIVDLDPRKADTWASQQGLHNDEIDFSKGNSDLSSANIGQAINILNKSLENVKETADEALHNSTHLEPSEPNVLDEAKISIIGSTVELLDTNTFAHVDCYSQVAFSTDILWDRGSTFNVYIDGILTDSLDTSKEDFKAGQYGKFNVFYYGDAYPEIKTLQGYYKGFSFLYESGIIDEGYHNVEIEEVPLDVTLPAIKLEPLKIPTFKPIAFGVVEYLNIPTQEQLIDYHVSGVGCCRNTLEIGMTIKAICYDTIFASLKQIRIWDSISNEWREVLAHSFTEGYALYTLHIPFAEDFKGRITIKTQAQTSAGIWGPEKEYISPYINRDTTHTEERIRVTLDGDDFDSIAELEKDSAQIINDNLVHAQRNWTQEGIGPDYSKHDETQYAYFRIPFNTTCNNFYFDIFDKDNNTLDTNKYGELKNIDIKVLISDSIRVSTLDNWINCNSPWKRKNYSFDDNNYDALDLFRSTPSRRWITFGETSRTGKYLYLKIQINSKSSINLLKLESSLQESLDERR